MSALERSEACACDAEATRWRVWYPGLAEKEVAGHDERWRTKIHLECDEECGDLAEQHPRAHHSGGECMQSADASLWKVSRVEQQADEAEEHVPAHSPVGAGRDDVACSHRPSCASRAGSAVLASSLGGFHASALTHHQILSQHNVTLLHTHTA